MSSSAPRKWNTGVVLTTLCLRNFKSFGDVSVPFGPFTLIYGSNGVGKSNLLDALRFLLAIGQGGRSVRDAIEGHASAAGGPDRHRYDGDQRRRPEPPSIRRPNVRLRARSNS